MKISLVVPVFNEEEAIPLFYKSVREYKEFADKDIEIVFVNDGSSDKTENIISALSLADEKVKVIHITRNFWQRACLICWFRCIFV